MSNPNVLELDVPCSRCGQPMTESDLVAARREISRREYERKIRPMLPAIEKKRRAPGSKMKRGGRKPQETECARCLTICDSALDALHHCVEPDDPLAVLSDSENEELVEKIAFRATNRILSSQDPDTIRVLEHIEGISPYHDPRGRVSPELLNKMTIGLWKVRKRGYKVVLCEDEQTLQVFYRDDKNKDDDRSEYHSLYWLAKCARLRVYFRKLPTDRGVKAHGEHSRMKRRISRKADPHALDARDRGVVFEG